MTDDQKFRLDADRDRLERFRERARGVAGLTATAAGALAAGLVLAPSDALPTAARIFGFAAVTLLVLATALFTTASIVSARSGPARHPWVAIAFKIWETTEDATADATEFDTLRATAKRMLERVRRLSNLGLWSAGLALASLVMALLLATFATPTMVTVRVDVIGSPIAAGSCPDVGREFLARTTERELSRAGPYIWLEIPADECGTPRSVWVQIEQSAVTLTGYSPK